MSSRRVVMWPLLRPTAIPDLDATIVCMMKEGELITLALPLSLTLQSPSEREKKIQIPLSLVEPVYCGPNTTITKVAATRMANEQNNFALIVEYFDGGNAKIFKRFSRFLFIHSMNYCILYLTLIFYQTKDIYTSYLSGSKN